MEQGKYKIIRWMPNIKNAGFREVAEYVEGTKTEYFGIREEESGWRITHLPSGYLLTLASFASAEDAHIFAAEVEARLSSLLSTGVPSVLRDLAGTYLNARTLREKILDWNRTKPILTREDIRGIF